MGNSDSIKKNTLWGTWKDGKIAPMLWDLDAIYGTGWTGTAVSPPASYMWSYYSTNKEWPLSLFWSLYNTEIRTAYAELRENNIISIDTWKEIMYGWVERIGAEAYERDIEKWPETPSYRKNMTNTDYWVEGGSANVEWDETANYEIGDEVYLKAREGESSGFNQSYRAIQSSQGVCPVTSFYDLFPRVGGYYDSPKRMEKWMREQIRLNDIYMDYV